MFVKLDPWPGVKLVSWPANGKFRDRFAQYQILQDQGAGRAVLQLPTASADLELLPT